MRTSRVDDISVLIVEDEPDLVQVLESYLDASFEVRTAMDGSEALEVVDDDVDVVLLDRRMPGMSGDEVLIELRRRGYEMPVAMLTAVDPDTDIVDMSFDDYLTKPVDRNTLVRTVHVLANRASFERKSREFFRAASKKATLDVETDVDHSEDEDYAVLIERLSDLQTHLDETLREMLAASPDAPARDDIDRSEVEALLSEIWEHTLPEEIRELVDEYQALESARPPFMWKWVHRLAPQNTLPCVDDAYTDVTPADKTIAILFVTLLDDVLEKNQDRTTFAEISKLPSTGRRPDPQRDGVDEDYVAFATRVWTTLVDRIERAPNYDRYADLFRFDVEQAVSAIEYSDIAIRRPDLATMSDLERYESHNMMLFAYADIDLMHSSIDVRDDLPTLREAIWTAQLMARIGNWVSTWERELREGDFSAGPVVYALENGIVSRDDLERVTDDPAVADELVERIRDSGVETEFLTRWEQQFHRLRSYDEEISSFDLEPFVAGTEEVLRYHLASAGLK